MPFRPRPSLPARLLRAALVLLVAACASLARAGDAAAPAAAASAPKVLRYAFKIAETNFDPAAVFDLYSRIVTGHIFEGLMGYDALARPVQLRPLTAAAMPEVDNDYRRFTFHIRPGIYFADDPAFGGRRRELVAADFVYALERVADPAVRSPNWGTLEQYGIVGLAQARRRAVEGHVPFDYDAPVAGLRALDRGTLQIELVEPRPRLLEALAQGDIFGAVAREVVERYGDDIGAHPVGTGPFRLAAWRRASHITLERNPGFREMFYDGAPGPDDDEGRALLARFKGRRLPMIDRVEISIIEQDQPRWLSFLNGDANFMERVPEAFIDIAMPGGKLAKNLARQHVQAYRTLVPDTLLTLFNLEDPVVGGMDPAHVALRRAIALGADTERESRLARHNQMIPAQSQVSPYTSGYDPAYRSEMGDFDPARARALLDTWGWVDRDGDGWREQPDGSPLTIVIATQSDAASHQYAELWQHNLDALGVRTDFRIAQWPENLKSARSGKIMMWDYGLQASTPDGIGAFEALYGPSAGGQNLARFKFPEFDRLYERALLMPDGPERLATLLRLKRIALAYMPYKARGHRLVTDLAMPEVVGYRRPLFRQDWWQYIDIEG